jgi:hypothetical protein
VKGERIGEGFCDAETIIEVKADDPRLSPLLSRASDQRHEHRLVHLMKPVRLHSCDHRNYCLSAAVIVDILQCMSCHPIVSG